MASSPPLSKSPRKDINGAKRNNDDKSYDDVSAAELDEPQLADITEITNTPDLNEKCDKLVNELNKV